MITSLSWTVGTEVPGSNHGQWGQRSLEAIMDSGDKGPYVSQAHIVLSLLARLIGTVAPGAPK